MKITIFAFCFLCAAAAFGQTASVIYANPQPIVIPSHPEHAATHAMGQESTLLRPRCIAMGRENNPYGSLHRINAKFLWAM